MLTRRLTLPAISPVTLCRSPPITVSPQGPGGEDIKALSERCRCSVVVEGKVANAAFVPFRLVNYLAHDVRQIIAAVGDVSGQLCKDDKYEAGE